MDLSPSLDETIRTLADNLPSHLSLALCRHGLMFYPKGDRYVGQSLERYGEFSEGEIELFRQVIPRDGVVIEVGANLGAHTVALAELVGPHGHVYAFEPQDYLFNILCANAAVNGRINVRCFPFGVGRELATLSLPPIDYTMFENFGAFSLSDQPGVPVEIRPLDAYAFTRLDFIKIDVEGMEQEVLLGAVNTIAHHRPLLYIENDREEKSEALIQTIMNMGYRLWWHLPPLYNPENFRGNPENIFPAIASFNMVCAPHGVPTHIELLEITRPDQGKQYAIENQLRQFQAASYKI